MRKRAIVAAIVATVFSVSQIRAQTGFITTVAGTGSSGFTGDNGPAISARLNAPRALAIDASGNLYIAEASNHRVRVVSAATGIITTIAGTGTSGFNQDGISATDAQLSSPRGLLIDALGDLYIADTGNHRVRRVDMSTGLISTVAGTGASGYNGDDILATEATLKEPAGLALDANGHLYIAERSGHRVRRVDAVTKTITTIAGTGVAGTSANGIQATAAQLNLPLSVALDAGGNLLIADSGNNRVRAVNLSTGIITTRVGIGTSGFSGDNGPATNARVSVPSGLVLDDGGNLFIADFGNDRVRRVDADTEVITTVAGTGTAGYNGDNIDATTARLNGPYALALDADANLFIAESAGHRVRRIEAAGETPNQPPTAEALFTLASPVCGAPGGTHVQLDATGSSDPDGDALSFTWTGPFAEGNGTVSGATPVVTLPLGGPFTIALSVDDGNGASASDSVQVTIHDTDSPVLTVVTPNMTVSPGTGQMRAVDVIAESGASAVDACDPNPVLAVEGPLYFNRGSTTEVIIRASDVHGNTVSSPATVTVLQGGPPANAGKPDNLPTPPGQAKEKKDKKN